MSIFAQNYIASIFYIITTSSMICMHLTSKSISLTELLKTSKFFIVQILLDYIFNPFILLLTYFIDIYSKTTVCQNRKLKHVKYQILHSFSCPSQWSCGHALPLASFLYHLPLVFVLLIYSVQHFQISSSDHITSLIHSFRKALLSIYYILLYLLHDYCDTTSKTSSRSLISALSYPLLKTFIKQLTAHKQMPC